jgi:uncharacterized SAM-binding protein YcdF (DUF218 family)/pimeloyl-ACP methyl ester carboxylesterase
MEDVTEVGEGPVIGSAEKAIPQIKTRDQAWEEFRQIEAGKPTHFIINGEATQEAWIRVNKELEEQKYVHPWENPERAVFTVTLGSPKEREEDIVIFALGGLPHRTDQYSLQQTELAKKYGAFVACDYPDNWMDLDLYLGQITDAISFFQAQDRKVIFMATSMGAPIAKLIAAEYKRKNQEAGKTKEIDGLVLNNPVSEEDVSSSILFFMERIAVDPKHGHTLIQNILKQYAEKYPYQAPPGVPEEAKKGYEENVRINGPMLLSRLIALTKTLKIIRRLKLDWPEKTTAIFGEDDALGGKTKAALLDSRIPIMNVSGGHSRMYEEGSPKKYLTAMDRCLRFLLGKGFLPKVVEKTEPTDQAEKKTQPSFDMIVVHGSGFKARKRTPEKPGEPQEPVIRLNFDTKMRALAAAIILENDRAPAILIAGGKTEGKHLPSEAKAIQEFLLKRGADPRRIFLEESSKGTPTNLKNIFNFVEAGSKVAVMSNEYHLQRIAQLAESLGLEVATISAEEILTNYPYRSRKGRFAQVVEKYNLSRLMKLKRFRERIYRMLLVTGKKGKKEVTEK